MLGNEGRAREAGATTIPEERDHLLPQPTLGPGVSVSQREGPTHPQPPFCFSSSFNLRSPDSSTVKGLRHLPPLAHHHLPPCLVFPNPELPLPCCPPRPALPLPPALPGSASGGSDHVPPPLHRLQGQAPASRVKSKFLMLAFEALPCLAPTPGPPTLLSTYRALSLTPHALSPPGFGFGSNVNISSHRGVVQRAHPFWAFAPLPCFRFSSKQDQRLTSNRPEL